MSCVDCGGVLSLWIDPASLVCDSPGDRAAAVRAASDWLYVATGRRFPGCGTARVHPLPDGWADADPTGLREVSGTAGSWTVPVRPRTIAGLPAIHLGVEPIMSASVVVDGAPFTAFRIVDRRWLVRTDGLAWPSTNDLSQDSGPGTWTVEVTYGRNPPPLGQRACEQLACRILAVLAGEACEIPANAVSVTREGLTIQLDDTRKTGLWLVDRFVAAYNPAGLARAGSAWSPEIGPGSAWVT